MPSAGILKDGWANARMNGLNLIQFEGIEVEVSKRGKEIMYSCI